MTSQSSVATGIKATVRARKTAAFLTPERRRVIELGLGPVLDYALVAR